MNLRSKINYLLFTPVEMSKLQLPTYFDVYRHFNTITGEEIYALEQTSKMICDIWYSASLPYLEKDLIMDQLLSYINIVKISIKNNMKKDENLYNKHKVEYDKLFDICSCQCEKICKCTRQDKIPPAELEFMNDQRSHRKLYIDVSSRQTTSIQSRCKQVDTRKIM